MPPHNDSVLSQMVEWPASSRLLERGLYSIHYVSYERQ